MENKNIIIGILVLIILVLACIMGSMLLPSLNAQKDSKITIIGNSTLYAGDNLTVKLTDLNNTPIEHELVKVTILDSDGDVVVDESLKTNSKGKTNLNLDLNPGKYNVNVTFSGNDNFTGSNATKTITIEEVVVEETYTQQSTSSYSSDSSSQSEYRPAVDSGGITREQADYYGYRYTPEHGGHYIGYLDHWDENAGVYHD